MTHFPQTDAMFSYPSGISISNYTGYSEAIGGTCHVFAQDLGLPNEFISFSVTGPKVLTIRSFGGSAQLTRGGSVIAAISGLVQGAGAPSASPGGQQAFWVPSGSQSFTITAPRDRPQSYAFDGVDIDDPPAGRAKPVQAKVATVPSATGTPPSLTLAATPTKGMLGFVVSDGGTTAYTWPAGWTVVATTNGNTTGEPKRAEIAMTNTGSTTVTMAGGPGGAQCLIVVELDAFIGDVANTGASNVDQPPGAYGLALPTLTVPSGEDRLVVAGGVRAATATDVAVPDGVLSSDLITVGWGQADSMLTAFGIRAVNPSASSYSGRVDDTESGAGFVGLAADFGTMAALPEPGVW